MKYETLDDDQVATITRDELRVAESEHLRLTLRAEGAPADQADPLKAQIDALEKRIADLKSKLPD